MKKALYLLIVMVLCIALVGCSGGQVQNVQTEKVDIPSYTLVDTNDVSIPGTTRVVYWVVVGEQIDEQSAQAIALNASAENADIDEVTVWIFDDEEGAKEGYIWDKLYQVEITKGKVIDTIKNPDYDPDFNPDSLLGEEANQQDADVNLEYKLYDTETDYVVILVTNTAGITLGEVNASVTFYKGGDMLSMEEDSYYQVADGKKLAFALRKPEDDNWNLVEYDNEEVSIKTEEDSGNFNDKSAFVETEGNKGADGFLIKCTNIGEDEINYVKYRVVYYAGDEVVGCGEAVDTQTIRPGDSLTLEANLPRDINHDDIDFDSYDILLVEAFKD